MAENVLYEHARAIFPAKCIALAYCELCSKLHRLDETTNEDDVS